MIESDDTVKLITYLKKVAIPEILSAYELGYISLSEALEASTKPCNDYIQKQLLKSIMEKKE